MGQLYRVRKQKNIKSSAHWHMSDNGRKRGTRHTALYYDTNITKLITRQTRQKNLFCFTANLHNLPNKGIQVVLYNTNNSYVSEN